MSLFQEEKNSASSFRRKFVSIFCLVQPMSQVRSTGSGLGRAFIIHVRIRAPKGRPPRENLSINERPPLNLYNMSKTITTHSLQVVTFGTTHVFSEVISRLDKEVGKPTSGISGLTRGSASKGELEALVNAVVGPSGFLFVPPLKCAGWSSSRPTQIFQRVQSRRLAPALLEYTSGRCLCHRKPSHRRNDVEA